MEPTPNPILVRVNCEGCGHDHVSASDLVVRLGLDDGSRQYRYRCRVCGVINVGALTPSQLALLRAAKVRTEQWRTPAELHEPRADTAFGEHEFTELLSQLEDDEGLALELQRLGVPSAEDE